MGYLKSIKRRFRGKTVYCNCDNPKFSNFWKYFIIHFKEFGLRKLIATYYDFGKPTYKYVLDSGNNKPVKTPLIGDGDFSGLYFAIKVTGTPMTPS